MMNLTLNTKFKSLEPFNISLPDFVVLTGLNGAGKTHLLTAVAHSNFAVIESEGVQLNSKKYVTSQTLAPNDSAVVTREQLNSNVQNLWNQFSSYLTQKQSNASYTLANMFGFNSPQIKLIERIAKSAKKNLDQLTSDDLYQYYPFDDGLPQSDVFYQNFSNLFKRYQDRYDDNNYREFSNTIKGNTEVTFLSKEEFVDTYGEAPWEFVNKIIKEANLDYHINSPVNTHRDAPFELKLIGNDSTEIKFGDLSSGEKVLMSLALALYNSKFEIEFPKVLLMDEPDASLHPSMVKNFLDVIQNVFVKEKKVKVIITTHSPSTIALAPDEAIFVVNKMGARIEKVDKDIALKILTAGVPSFSIHYENRRQIFVESPNDVTYFERLYQKLSSFLVPEISLSFISSGESRTDKNGSKISNCSQVLNITQILRSTGNKSVFGLIDWDLVNQDTEGVKVLGNNKRYSIENYILDPIFISALLLREKIVGKEVFGLKSSENYLDFRNFSSARLQIICDWFLGEISKFISQNSHEKIEVELINGCKLQLPTWYLHYQGHSLEEKILNLFPQLNGIKKQKEEALKLEIIDKIIDDLPSLISIDLLDIFKALQQS